MEDTRREDIELPIQTSLLFCAERNLRPFLSMCNECGMLSVYAECTNKCSMCGSKVESKPMWYRKNGQWVIPTKK